MSIRVEGDKLIVEKWIERIHYQPPSPAGYPATAIIITDSGTYTMEDARANELRDHPKANLPVAPPQGETLWSSQEHPPSPPT